MRWKYEIAFSTSVSNDTNELAPLSQHEWEVLKVLRKMEIWTFYISITTEQTPSADEDCVIWLNAPEKLLNRPGGEIVFITVVTKVKSEL